ncbi:MAG: hypothetical protein WCT19_00225 [Candidatus Paceibacterota bacterium]
MAENFEGQEKTIEELKIAWEQAADKAIELSLKIKDMADDNFGLSPDLAREYRGACEEERKAFDIFFNKMEESK